LSKYSDQWKVYARSHNRSDIMPTLWQNEKKREAEALAAQQEILKKFPPDSQEYKNAEAKIKFIQDKRRWIQEQLPHLKYEIMPLIRSFHWEDDAGGESALNQQIPWWELSRINRKDLVAALIFGIRISLVVGIIAVAISLMIGIPVGAFAGFYGGTFDIIVS